MVVIYLLRHILSLPSWTPISSPSFPFRFFGMVLASYVTALAVIADGKALVSGDAKGTLKVNVICGCFHDIVHLFHYVYRRAYSNFAYSRYGMSRLSRCWSINQELTPVLSQPSQPRGRDCALLRQTKRSR